MRRTPALAAAASTAAIAASNAASSRAASFKTRTSSRVRLSASGAECQTASASTPSSPSTSEVSPRPSSAVRRISREKSMPPTSSSTRRRPDSIAASLSAALRWESTTGVGWPRVAISLVNVTRSEEHTSELQSPCNLVCRLLLEKKKELTNMLQLYLHYRQLARYYG